MVPCPWVLFCFCFVFSLFCFVVHWLTTLGEGHWPRKGVWGCGAVMTPFFQASWRSPSLPICHQCAAPLMYPHLQFEKKCISALLLVKIAEYSLPRPPLFSRETRSLDPLLGTRAAHTHHKSWVFPRGSWLLYNCPQHRKMHAGKNCLLPTLTYPIYTC